VDRTRDDEVVEGTFLLRAGRQADLDAIIRRVVEESVS